MEKEIGYQLEKESTGDKKHDKIFKEILQNKNEMVKFLNHFINQNIKNNDLQNYSESYITKDYKYKTADVVYKLKKEEVYYLIEHQTKVDYSMPYRMFNYCMEIIRSAIQNKQINKATYRYPVVVPIVLYTGNRKWTASTSFAKIQIKKEGIAFKPLDVKYQLIDVNKYEIEELLKEKTMLANAMILEKCKNNDEVINCIKRITKNVEDKVQLAELKRLIMYLYGNMDRKNINKILKLIEESEDEEYMSTIAERLKREYNNERKVGIKLGISQTISQIIEKMLKMNIKEELIQEVTGTKIEKIEEIKKQMQN